MVNKETPAALQMEPLPGSDAPASPEAAPGAQGAPEDAGRTYTQAEVDEIVRERLEAALAKANLTPEERRAAALDEREFQFERRKYLTEKIQGFGMAEIRTPYSNMMRRYSNPSPYEKFRDTADGLLGLWEATDIDGFKKSVDALFEVFDALISEAGRRFEAEEEARRTGEYDAVERAEHRDVMKEIFKKGGILN